MHQHLIMTGENDLFLMRDGKPIFLRCTGITELVLRDQDKGIVTLVGYLPDALKLQDIESGDIIEVVSSCCGNLRDKYDAEGVIVRLELFDVGKEIPNLVALRPEQNMRLSIEVIASCRVAFLFKSPEET